MDDERLNEPAPYDPPRFASIDGADSGALENPAALAVAERLGRGIRLSFPPPDELAAARVRVWARVQASMTSPSRAIVPIAATRRRARRRISRFRGLVAAALLLVTVATSLAVSRAAANALPSSPLYAVKRAEEWVALQTAQSDARRGDVLGMLAERRLDEALRESARGDQRAAQALVGDYQTDVVAIINLAGSMAARHEDNTEVIRTVSQVLAVQVAAEASAEGQGQAQLADAFRQAGQAASAAIDRNGLSLPYLPPGIGNTSDPLAVPPGTPGNRAQQGPSGLPQGIPPSGTGNGRGNGNGGLPVGGGSPIRSTPAATPGGGNGMGDGVGNGSGNGNGHGRHGRGQRHGW